MAPGSVLITIPYDGGAAAGAAAAAPVAGQASTSCCRAYGIEL